MSAEAERKRVKVTRKVYAQRVGDLCIVCDSRERVGLLFCNPCNRSFDEAWSVECTIATAVAWAAKRARTFERKRRR